MFIPHTHIQDGSLKPLQHSPVTSDAISIIPQLRQLQRPKPILTARITFACGVIYKKSEMNTGFHKLAFGITFRTSGTNSTDLNQLKKRNMTVISRFSMKEYYFGSLTRGAVLRVIKALKKLKVLFALELGLASHHNAHPLDPILHVRRLKTLNKLTMTHDYGKISIEETQSLADNLKHVPNLSSLALRYSGSSLVTSEQVKSIAKSISESIKCLTSLSHLSLSFSKGINITNTGVSTLASRFHRLQSLSSLMLDFSRTSYMTDKGLEDLSLGIQHMSSLSKLTLNLSQCGGGVSSKGIKNLSVAMRCLNLSCSFNLSLKAWSDIHQTGVESLFGGSTYLTSISSLTLDFECSPVKDDAIIKGLATGLNHLTSLSHLSLNFTDNAEISNQGASSLAETLKDIVSLSSLRLCFRGCYQMPMELVMSIFISLGNLPSLTKLALDFSKCFEITDEAVEALSRGLTKTRALTLLDLRVGGLDKLSDKVMVSLSSCLKELHLLSSLTLSFFNCHQITDNGVESLCDGISYLDVLSSVALDLSCEKITVDGVKSVFGCMKHLTWLSHVRVNFSDCPNVSKVDMKKEVAGLEHIASLYIRAELSEDRSYDPLCSSASFL